MSRPDELDRERKRILRRLGLLTWGLWAAAVVLALAGGALIAWLFSSAGFPFLRTWLVVSAVLLVVPALIHLLAGGARGSDGDDGTEGGGDPE